MADETTTPQGAGTDVLAEMLPRILATGLTVMAALPVLPPVFILGFAVAAIATRWLEERFVTSGGWLQAMLLAALASTPGAVIAFFLIIWGEPAARLFSFAFMAVSMVHVLMRHHQTPPLFLAGVGPHMAVLGLVSWGLVSEALKQGDALSALTPLATVALFGVLFWTARAQLALAWADLSKAKSEAQERERAADAANQAKTHFLATVSHEIRTPLNGVLGMAQAMAGDDLSDVQRERLKTIRRSGETLLAVVNDVLDLSKIEASKLELELVEFDMAHLARGVVAAFTPLANRKGVSFGFEIEDAACGVYRGDSTRLRQILYNLVSNAVKFTESGGIKVAIRRDGGNVLFAVADTGIGISPEGLLRLFDNFFQADASTTRRFGGTGLGLAICRELVKLMGGAIETESRLGEGTVFRVTLPLPRTGDKLEPRAAPAPVAQDPRPGDLRVLAAEDNDVNQLVLKTLLLQAGITPTLVGNGREALEAWEQADWDVILMDVQMPEMDGPTAAKTIREREAATGRRRTPIVALTANAMSHQAAEYLAAGMDGLVPKPIEIAKLFAALEEALDAAGDQPGTSSSTALAS